MAKIEVLSIPEKRKVLYYHADCMLCLFELQLYKRFGQVPEQAKGSKHLRILGMKWDNSAGYVR